MKIIPLVLVMVSSTFTEACPDNCRCTNRKIFCTYSTIKSLPEGSPTTTLVSMERDFLINLNDSVIGKSGLANLTTLRLINMHVRSIQAEDFRSMKKSLTITRNNITDLQPGAFIGLGKLHMLVLSDNELNNLRSGVFEGLGCLRHLNLRNNPIYVIHFGFFDGLRRECNCQLNKTPSILDLSSFSNMDHGALRNLCFFTQLKTSFIHGLQAKNFCSLRSLKLQYCHSNEYWSGILEGLFNVIHVTIYKCYLKKIPNQFLKDSHLLKKLIIRESKIEELEFNCFHGLQSLAELDLSNNFIWHLKTTVFTDLRYLKKLDLSSNFLYTIHESSFMGLSHLKFLDMSYNYLQSIKAGTFSQLSSLRELNIVGDSKYIFHSDNKIKTIQSEAFLGLFSLKSLRLPYNTSPNVTLDSMHRLDYFEGPGHFVTNNLQIIKSLSITVSGVNITRNHIDRWINHILYFEQSIHLKIYDLTTLRELKLFSGFHISDLSIKNIKTGPIENNSFECFSNLTSLTIISYSEIKINLGAFRNLENLGTLKIFSEDGIIQPEEGAFEELRNLKQLSLAGTDNYYYPFTINFSSDTFKGMKSLTELEIKNNGKLSLHGDPFHELENLEILYLGFNSITELNKGTFRGLRKLESLNLELNRISVLRKGTFDGLKNLKKLHFRINRIESVSAGVFGAICDDNFTLTCANLTRLWTYCDTQFVLENLINLNLEYNEITFIHQHAFLGCNKLQTLNLRYNRLKTLDFLYTPELTDLNLYYNRNLSTLSNSTFNCTTKLSIINFRETDVVFMHETILQHLKQLNEIKLPRMKCNCRVREIWQWLRSRNVIYDFNEHPFFEDIDLCLSQLDCNISKTIAYYQRNETSAENDYVHFRTYIEPVVFIFIFLSGCFGNGFLLFIILRHSDMRNKNNICVAHLAIIDILALILNLPLSYWDSVHVNWDLGETSCKLFMGSKDLAVSLVVFSVVTLAFERYLVVQSFNTMKIPNGSVARPIFYLIYVWMYALATSIPTYLLATVEGRCYLSSPGIVEYIRFLQTFQLIMNCCSPVAIIIYLNIVTVYTLRKSITKIPGVLTNQPYDRNRNTVVNTVTILSVVFTLSYVPNFFLRTLVSWSVWKAKDVFWYSFVSYCLFFIHSIFNPFTLFVMSSKFKKHIREYTSYFVHENDDFETNPNLEKSLFTACPFLHNIPVYFTRNEQQDDVQILSTDEAVRQARLERLKKLQDRFR